MGEAAGEDSGEDRGKGGLESWGEGEVAGLFSGAAEQTAGTVSRLCDCGVFPRTAPYLYAPPHASRGFLAALQESALHGLRKHAQSHRVWQPDGDSWCN